MMVLIAFVTGFFAAVACFAFLEWLEDMPPEDDDGEDTFDRPR